MPPTWHRPPRRWLIPRTLCTNFWARRGGPQGIQIGPSNLTTPQNITNAQQVHINALEFIFWASAKFGFKISKRKFKPWQRRFKFLGHFFDVERCTNMIPPPKLKAFAEFRPPALCAEAVSRLGVLACYARYILIMKLVAQPIQAMAQSGVFAWTEVHQESWACLKMLACLGFETHLLDPTRPLYYTCHQNLSKCICLDTIMCEKCNLFRELCNCTKQCSNCNMFKMTNELRSQNKHLACNCENNFIEALRTKLAIQHNFDTTAGVDNLIVLQPTEWRFWRN